MSTFASNKIGPAKRNAIAIQQELNIRKRVEEENRLRHQMNIERSIRKAAFVSNWADDSTDLVAKSGMKRMEKSKREALVETSRQLLARRRESLKQRLDQDWAEYETELARRGLVLKRTRK